MMKSKIYILLFFCACLVGCVDDSYRGMYDIFHSGHTTSDIPVWIKIGESTNLGVKSTTKGSGVVESADDFKDKNFYVYAFNKDKGTSYKVRSAEDEINTLIDGSIDDVTSVEGRSAMWNRKYERVVWKDPDQNVERADVYWPKSQARDFRYDFFAYYLDDIKVDPENIHRTEDQINIDIEIDGKQDIISSKAAPSDLKLDAMFPNEIDKIAYKYYYCYSYQSAMMNLQPEFVFNHQLSKIRFRLMPGVTEGRVNKITLHSLSIESCYKGSFRVAAKDQDQGIQFHKEYVKSFDMFTESSSPYDVYTASNSSAARTPIDIDGYLLLAPSNNGYYVTMQMSEIRDVGGPNEETLRMVPYTTFIYRGSKESPDPFLTGEEYVVTMHVFGREDIRVNIDVKPWEPGGYVIPDTEQMPE